MRIRNWQRQGRRSTVILVNTNILMDVIASREPYDEYEKRILEKCAKKEVTGIMAAHSIPNLFYILRKDFSQEERRALLKDLCSIFRISDLNTKKIIAALDNDKFIDSSGVCRLRCPGQNSKTMLYHVFWFRLS